MRRVWSYAFLAMMLMLTFAGCGAKSAPEPDDTVLQTDVQAYIDELLTPDAELLSLASRESGRTDEQLEFLCTVTYQAHQKEFSADFCLVYQYGKTDWILKECRVTKGPLELLPEDSSASVASENITEPQSLTEPEEIMEPEELMEPQNDPENAETLPFSYEIEGDSVTITAYLGEESNVVIPDEIEGKPVTVIGDKAFAQSTLISVTLPKNLRKIGEYAFIQCNEIEEIFIPDQVTEIVRGAFWKCYNLKQVFLPDGLLSIDEDAFLCCDALETLYLPEGLEYIGDYAFFQRKTKLTLYLYQASFSAQYARRNGIPFVVVDTASQEMPSLGETAMDLDSPLVQLLTTTYWYKYSTQTANCEEYTFSTDGTVTIRRRDVMEQEGAYEDELYGTAYRIKVYPYDIDEAAGAVEIYGDYGKTVWYLNEETGWLGNQYISSTGLPDGTGISILWPYETPPDLDTIRADEREYQVLFDEFIDSIRE